MTDPYTIRLRQLVGLVEEGWTDFGFLLFRTHYNDESFWNAFLEAKDQILTEAITNAPAESGLSRITDKMFLKQVSNEVLRDITPEQVAIAYRSLEDDANGGMSEDRVEPGLRTNVCLMVDEECMRSVAGWREGDEGSVPFVKAVDVILGDEEELGYSGVFRVAIQSLFTKFYVAQVECGEMVELVPAGDGVWRGMGSGGGWGLEGDGVWRWKGSGGGRGLEMDGVWRWKRSGGGSGLEVEAVWRGVVESCM